MLAKLRVHLRHNVVGYIALFVALGGTGAYAADTIGSADVIDESLLSQDLKDGDVTTSDLRIGLTAVGDSPEQADASYRRAAQVLADEAAPGPEAVLPPIG